MWGTKTAQVELKVNECKPLNMGDMFSRVDAFNQPLAEWNTTAVTNMDFMFYRATAFAQDITGWSTPSVIGDPYAPAQQMFDKADAWVAKFERIDAAQNENGPPSDWKPTA